VSFCVHIHTHTHVHVHVHIFTNIYIYIYIYLSDDNYTDTSLNTDVSPRVVIVNQVESFFIESTVLVWVMILGGADEGVVRWMGDL